MPRPSPARLALPLAVLLAAFLAAPAGAAVTLSPVGTFVEPIYLAAPPADSSRIFVVERGASDAAGVTTRNGQVKVVRRSDNAVLGTFLERPVDARGERGLLSMAFAPDYATSGKVYAFVTPEGGNGTIQVEELTRSAGNPNAVDPASRRTVLSIPHSAGNHNGGQLQFGADGMLYVSVGDNAVATNAQDLTNLYGKVYRIDPRAGTPYAIPSGNPFAGNPSCNTTGSGTLPCPEIWAYGLRNPFRFSVDRLTGDLLIGDVGGGAREEINLSPLSTGGGNGANYGWCIREGLIPGPCGGTLTTRVDPVFDYPHTTPSPQNPGGPPCWAVSGGYVVRDENLPSLVHRYVYGDLCGGAVRSLIATTPAAVDDRDVGVSVPPATLYSFGEDSDCGVYVVSGAGAVSRLSEGSPPRCAAVPGIPQTGPPGANATVPGGAPGVAQGAASEVAQPRALGPLDLDARGRQDVDRRAVLVSAGCDAACVATGSGRIAFGAVQAQAAVRLGRARRRVEAGRRATLRLRLSARTVRAVRSALGEGRRATARVTVTARDAAGNARTARVRVRLVP